MHDLTSLQIDLLGLFVAGILVDPVNRVGNRIKLLGERPARYQQQDKNKWFSR